MGSKTDDHDRAGQEGFIKIMFIRITIGLAQQRNRFHDYQLRERRRIPRAHVYHW
jgi:hypothetical protein